jgi:uncharacterized protein YkwD
VDFCVNLYHSTSIAMKLVFSSYLSRPVFLGLSLGLMIPFWSFGAVSNIAQAAPAQVVTLAPPSNAIQAVQQLALELVNGDRAAGGLPPMQVDPLLSEAAQSHAEDMLRRNYFDHYSPEGRSPSDRLAAAGGSGFPAENIVMGENRFRVINIQLLENFQSRWMHSADHRRNLMNPYYERFGYGLAIDPSSGRALAVQMFTRR